MVVIFIIWGREKAYQLEKFFENSKIDIILRDAWKWFQTIK